MPQNNNNSTTLLELALLAKDVYTKNAKDRGVNGWEAVDDQRTSNFDSGLQIQNYRNDNHPNHTVIAIAGTNGLNDWDDNLSFVTGGFSEQFQQAMTHAAKTIDAAVKNSEHTDAANKTFSVTGHSLGGGIAQIIAYTFGLNGVTLDAPGANAIISSKKYQAHLALLQQKYPNAFNDVGGTPDTGENFTNIVEQGSIVSSIGTHIGTKMEIDAVGDTDTVIGAIMMAVNPLIGLAIMAASLFGNHDIQPIIDYVQDDPNLNKLQLTGEKIEQLHCELGAIARESKIGNPIDAFTFETTTQALDPWQGNDIVELNDQGKWVVNAPTIAFNDIGDLFNAEQAMFQELQEGWITHEEFNAFQDYVLNHAKGDYNYNYDDSQTDRHDSDLIGAFYDSQSAQYDNAQSIARYTGVLINSNNQALSVAQLQALDTNNDGQLTGSETNILRLWQDINEDGHLDTGELVNLNTLNHPIQQSEYVFYVSGNAHVANKQPIQTSQTNELDTPNSDYRTLRDTDHLYYYLSNGRTHFVYWDPAMIKIHNNKSHIIGTDGDDTFDVDYYNNDFFDLSLITHFLAGDGDDTMGGSERSDNLWGGLGNDEILGYAGNDKIYGEQGNDKIFGAVGNDTILGGSGDDIIVGFTASNNVKQTLSTGETDNDRLYGGSGNDELYGGLGNDYLDGGANNDILLGEEGNDKLWGGSGNDEVQGNEGNDELMGGDGEDRLFGQTGNDKLWGGEGKDLLLGFTAANEVKQSLNTGETDNDYLNGGGDDDILMGGLGHDRLYGGTGNDELQGNEGDDKLYGEAGNDNLFGQSGDDILYGGDGDDYLTGFTASNEAKQKLNGEESDNDHLYGGAGQDVLIGGPGNDYLDGGIDADVMVGGLGNDIYIINSVNDSIYEQDNQGYDTVISSASYLLNANIEELRLLEGFNIHGTGNASDNKIIGNSANNIIDGVTGADEMIGGLGNDTYYVDNINDSVVEYANQGTDTIQSSITYTLSDNIENLTLLDFSKAEKGQVDGEAVLVYGFPKRNELDYMQGDAIENYQGTCALTSIANLITQTGTPTSESEVVNTAIANNWAVNDPSLPASQLGGSNYLQQQAILNNYGIANDVIQGYNETGIANLLQGGRGVMLSVNAGILWNDSNYNGNGSVNHAVTLTGAVHNANTGDLMGFYISDSGRGKVNDMNRFVDIDTFRKAADVNSAYSIHTREAVKLWDENIDATGNNNDNNIIGNRGDNVLQGLAGNDTIYAEAGNDIIIGGLGADTLNGGIGNDTYNFNLGDGSDIIIDTQGVDAIVFGDGIGISDVSITKNGNDLLLTINTQDSILLKDTTENRVIERIMFADGAMWHINEAHDNFNANTKGRVYLQGETLEGQTLTLVNTLSDADGMGELSYQWQYSTDKEVWVNIVSATTDELTLTQTHTGKYIKVITSYTDGRGNLETTTTLTKTTVSDATINLSSVEDQDLTITTAQLLTNVVGSKLSIINFSVVGNNATLIDNNNSTWTLTPKNDFSGKIELSYQISDGGSTTDATADVNITAVADAPSIINRTNDNIVIHSNSTLVLPISVTLKDNDGSESLNVTIKNLPNEVSLNHGNKQGDGSWSLSESDLTGLKLIAGDYSGHLDVEVEARTTEISNNNYATETRILSIDVIMRGDVNDNQLIGDEGDNIIQSLAGDDTLVGNAGSDTLTGGLGSDTFDYNSNNDGHDIITDFNLSEGDKLDISDLIDYQVNNNLADFVSVENIGNDSIVHIDSDGTGIGESYVSITLSNTTLSFEDLSNANALVVL